MVGRQQRDHVLREERLEAIAAEAAPQQRDVAPATTAQLAAPAVFAALAALVR